MQRTAPGDRTSRTDRHCGGPQRPRRSISFEGLPGTAEGSRTHRIDGEGGRRGGQRDSRSGRHIPSEHFSPASDAIAPPSCTPQQLSHAVRTVLSSRGKGLCRNPSVVWAPDKTSSPPGTRYVGRRFPTLTFSISHVPGESLHLAKAPWRVSRSGYAPEVEERYAQGTDAEPVQRLAVVLAVCGVGGASAAASGIDGAGSAVARQLTVPLGPALRHLHPARRIDPRRLG
jgi:hypothetical protein